MDNLMTTEQRERAVPPHEDDKVDLVQLYADQEFVDDISGAALDKGLATQARRTEIQFFKGRGVYSKRRRESWMKVITTKWIDQNKGDEA